jgi:hypothetical protein
MRRLATYIFSLGATALCAIVLLLWIQVNR